MEDLKKFDYEHFDFEKLFQEVKESIKKPNILVCGATGVGKSSLINAILNIDTMETAAEIGDDGRPKTRGVHLYSAENSTLNLYDSEGYEVGSLRQEYYKKMILDFIDDRIENAPTDFISHIHEVWYCVSAGNKRFFDIDRDLILEIEKRHIPIMILITKVDEIDEDELAGLKSEIRRTFPKTAIYTYSTQIPCASEYEDIYDEYVQTEEITDWAIENIDEKLRGGILPAVKKGIKQKKQYIIKRTIPKYAGFAAAAVTATSFVSVPFTDSAVLMPLQVKMSMEIINSYGIKAGIGNLLSGVVSTTAVSYVGRTISTQLIGIIPGIGGAAKAVVNVSVAASVTATLGTAIALVCEQYLKLCVDKEGKATMKFEEFFTAEKIKETLKYVSGHESEFNLKEIIEQAVKKAEEKKKK